MPQCLVCGKNDFVEEDGLFYCSECNTRNEDARVELFEENFDDVATQPSQWLVCSQIKVEPEDEISNVKVLTSWETFNICLRGLVYQLKELGATPKFEAMVFKYWTEYLQKTEAAFFSSHKKPPKLPNHAWNSDAFLVYNIQKSNSSLEEILGRKQKGPKRNIADVTQDNVVDLTNDTGEPPAKLTKVQQQKIKRDFFNKSFADSQKNSSLNNTAELVILSSKSEKEKGPKAPKEILSKEDNAEIVPLRRKHLVAFIYLGMLMSKQEFFLSDVLRWIDEGHLHYHELNKFFMPGIAVLDDLKEYFMDKKTTPKYCDISRLTRTLARFFCVRSIPPADVNGLVHKYCNEFNLPNQVALVSRRLIQLLPIRVQDPELFNTITSWETRAMAQVIVTMKILLGLDDASEHRNSKIASKISELLSKGGSSIEPFIWDDWVRWSALRSIALLLHGKTSAIPRSNTGLYQNVDALVTVWANYVSSGTKMASAKRQKMETEVMTELLRSLNWDILPSESYESRPPATTTPLASYTEAVLRDLVQNRLPCSDDSWNALVRHIDFTELSRDFRSKSIEYLLHPERYIEWAQKKGLPIGLRNGGAFRKAYKSQEVTLAKEANPPGKVKWRVSLTKKNKKKSEKEVLTSGAKSVVLPVATKPDDTDGRPLEPLDDLTEHVPVASKVVEFHAPAPCSMPLPEEEDQYLHVPSTEYFTHSGKARDAPISFRYLVEIAARYLRIPATDLLLEVKVVEDVHKNFLDFCSEKVTKDSPEVLALKK